MATCPECDAEIEVDEFDVDKGDLISCPDCGSNLEVTSIAPVELESVEDDEDDEDDDEEGEEDELDDDDADDVDEDESDRGLRLVTHAPLASEPRRRRVRRSPGRRRISNARQAALDGALRDLPSLIVAYSGGVDSAYLAYAAHRALGAGALCGHRRQPQLSRAPSRARPPARARLRLQSPGHPDRRNGAPRIPRQPRESVLLLQARALHAPLGARARRAASRRSPTAATPTIAATTGPGARRRASSACAARSTRPASPRTEIRELSRRAGLPTWDEPASACLSSRIPYFSEVTDEKLRMIERAETVLRDLGFRICRVRHHDTIARLELGRDEMARALEPETAAAIDRELRAIGYAHVTVDLARLPAREPERRAPSARGLIPHPVRAQSHCGARAPVPRGAPVVPAADARRHRLDQLRPRRRRLRRRASTSRIRPAIPSSSRSERCRPAMLRAAGVPFAGAARARDLERALGRRARSCSCSRSSARWAAGLRLRLRRGWTPAGRSGVRCGPRSSRRASPLFWFTALRPLSDMTGLAAAVAAQALIVSAIARRGASRALILGRLRRRPRDRRPIADASC